jgi:chaperone required for assembly of F1-ATPase
MTEPEAGARGAGKKIKLPKRFYTDVKIKADGAGRGALLLDGKPVRTPGKAPLVAPNAALAEAIAGEWRGQEERIDPETMPLTRLANSVLDGVAGREASVIDDILAYAGSDLLCYRADGPEGLARSQATHWDPVVEWAKRDLGAPMRLAQGVMHVTQTPAALEAIGKQLAPFDTWSLAALHVLTGLTGSALLALAIARGRLSPDEAWAAAHVDEDWQIAEWGEDEEAKERRERRRRDFAAAAQMLSLLS